MKQRRVLVTGAGGFVGRNLTRGFADLGWQVVGLDRAFDAKMSDVDVRRVIVELDDRVPDEVPAVDLVVHAAWVTTDPGTLVINRREYHSANLAPLTAALLYAHRVEPADFVFLSSSGIFAPNDATGGLTDAHDPTGASPYAVAKLTAERVMEGAINEEATVGHVVRLGYLFGPGEVARASRTGLSLPAAWMTAAREGRPLEVRDDDPARDWTFVSDLAAALEKLVDGPPAGRPIHLGSPHVYRDSALAALVADQFPGSEVVTVPASSPVKPPMVPSDIPALRNFVWTDAATGIRRLLAEESAA